MTQTSATYPLAGGLDLTTAALAVPPGRLIAAMNYEPIAEGYGRIAGYERFDGRPLASRATHSAIQFAVGRFAPPIGSVIEGVRSGATAQVIATPFIESGAFADGNAVGWLGLKPIAGSFQAGENLERAGASFAIAGSGSVALGGPNEEVRNEWALAVQNTQRNTIGKVPGTGPVRGVAALNGAIYAWRDQTSGAKCFRATPTGWAEAEDGFPAGGRYQFIGHNFFGALDRYRLYGVNGVGKAFEFDGTTASFITTGMTVDKPTRVAEIAQHLLLTFPGGSVQLSSTGEPTEFTPLTGAAEIGLGDEVTDVLQANETAVVLFALDKVATLTGRDVDSFQLDELTEEAGAEPWTAQRITTSVYLDRRGLRTLSATDAYGNFRTGTLTELITPFLQYKRRTGARPVMSIVSKAKAQYRLYYDDGSGFTVYMGRKQAEVIPFTLGDLRVTCAWVTEQDDGSEGIFAGAADGYVYRLDSGNSFDGRGIPFFAMLPFNHLGSINQDKRYHGVVVELTTPGYTLLGLTAQFDYADNTQPRDDDNVFAISGGGREFIGVGGGGTWDPANWNDFYWAAAFEGVAHAPIDGFGRNISVLIGGESKVLEPPHTLQAYTILYAPRRAKRWG